MDVDGFLAFDDVTKEAGVVPRGGNPWPVKKLKQKLKRMENGAGTGEPLQVRRHVHTHVACHQ